MKLKEVLITIMAITMTVVLVFSMFFGAVLQESYRTNPPTEKEVRENPSLARYLP